jgi:hypothetical protein
MFILWYNRIFSGATLSWTQAAVAQTIPGGTDNPVCALVCAVANEAPAANGLLHAG